MSATPLPSYPAMIAMLGLLFCVAPATIDAYLPAFDAIGAQFAVSPDAVQGTLGIYTCAYAVMLLLHGRLSDSFGRKPVICGSLLMYILATTLAACAPSFDWLALARVGQGISAGAGIVVGQALIKDCYRDVQARRAMSHTLMAFNISPALAPIVGGYLIRFSGWRSIFAFMALVALAALLLCLARLPETLPAAKRRPFSAGGLLADYRRLARKPGFMGVCVSSGLLVGGQAFIIGAAPDLIANVLSLRPQDFGYLFVPLVIGAMTGAWLSARTAGRMDASLVILAGHGVMGVAAALALAYGLSAPPYCAPGLIFAFSLYVCGLSLCAPCMALHAMNQAGSGAGAAASVLGFTQIACFAVVGGWCVPLIYGRPDWLGVALLVCVAASRLGWLRFARTAPDLAPT